MGGLHALAYGSWRILFLVSFNSLRIEEMFYVLPATIVYWIQTYPEGMNHEREYKLHLWCRPYLIPLPAIIDRP